MAWCGQATSHYLSQCWPRSMSPNGVTRPQWVNHCRFITDQSLIRIFNEKALNFFFANRNILRMRQNGGPFVDVIFKQFFLMTIVWFWFKFHRSLFLIVWIDRKSIYLELNRWQFIIWMWRSLTHTCVTQPSGVDAPVKSRIEDFCTRSRYIGHV